MTISSALPVTRQKALLKNLFIKLEEVSGTLAEQVQTDVKNDKNLKDLNQILGIFDKCQEILKEIEPPKPATVKKGTSDDVGKYRLELAERLDALHARTHPPEPQ